MFNETLVNIAFRLINFIALIAIIVYFFRRYFLGTIHKKIAQEKSETEALTDQISQLQVQQTVLSRDLLAQQERCQELSQRVTQWQYAFAQQTEERQRERQELRRKSAERTEKQKKSLEQEYLVHRALPEAIEQIHTSLCKKFSDSQCNKEFVADIVKNIQKEA